MLAYGVVNCLHLLCFFLFIGKLCIIYIYSYNLVLCVINYPSNFPSNYSSIYPSNRSFAILTIVVRYQKGPAAYVQVNQTFLHGPEELNNEENAPFNKEKHGGNIWG